MRYEGPVLTMRTLEPDDEAFILELFADWTYDGKRFTAARAEKAMGKWLNDMAVQPAERPCTSTSLFREAIVIEDASGPIGLYVRVVRGSEVNGNKSSLNESELETLVLLPGKRNQGIVGAEFATIGTRFTFEIMGVDVMILPEIADTAETRAITSNRGFTDGPTKNTPRGLRNSASFSRADWEARVAGNPDEANARFVFTP
jgi:hypothetical protein